MQAKLARSLAWLIPMVLAVASVGCGKGPDKKEAGSGAAAKSSGDERAAVQRPEGEPGVGKTVASGPPSSRTRLASLPDGLELGDGIFSADGRRFAYVGKRDGKAIVVVDGNSFGPYDEARRPVLEGDGSAFAFIAKKDGAEFVVANGVEGSRYEAVGGLRLSSTGAVFYAAARGGKWRVVSGTTEGAVAGDSEPPIFLTTDSRRLVYIEQRSEKGTFRVRSCSLSLSECTSGPDREGISLAMADPAGVALGYVVTGPAGQAVATVPLGRSDLKEKVGPWYHYVSIFGMARGGGHLAFVAGRKDGELLVTDGKEQPFPGFDDPLELAVSATGRTLAVGIMDEKVVAYLDGKALAGDYEEIEYPSFSPDGSRWALIAGKEPKLALVVDGKMGPQFEKIVDPRFTPDGGRIVYRARRDGKRFVVIADSSGRTLHESPRYDAVFGVVVQADGKAIGYGAVSEKTLWWVTE